MKSSKRITLTLLMVLAYAAILPTLSVADTWNRATKLTFSEPVEVPGMVLPSGTYWFTLANSQSNRNIVQIWNGDRTQLLKTLIAIPNYRLQPTSDTVIHFAERPTGTPEAIRSWFYPGMNYGQEFVYPKARAVQLASAWTSPAGAFGSRRAETGTSRADSSCGRDPERSRSRNRRSDRD